VSSEALRVGIVAPVQRIDPYGTIDYIGGVVAGQLFQPPFGFVNAGSAIRPVVFADPLRKETETRWSGVVRPGLKFSDGSSVTADDVIASLKRAWTEDRGVTLDKAGGRISFEFPDELSDPHPMLVPTWCAVSKAGAGEIGSGAYVLGEGSTSTEIRLVRNPHYGGEQGPASIKEVILRCYQPDADGTCAPLRAAVESGEIDFTQVLSRDEAASLSRVRKLYQPGSSAAILFLNCERLTAPQRQGICASLDRYALTSLCYSNPAGFVARGLLPPRMGSFGDGVAPRPVDAETFADLGRLKLAVIWGPRPYISKPLQVAELLKDQLASVGLQVDVDVAPDADTYFKWMNDGEYDAVLTGWIADSGDPADFLSSLLASDCIPQVGVANPAAANLARWQNAEADELLGAIRSGGEAELMGRLVRLVGEEAPLLPLMYGPSVTVLSRRVRSFEPHPLNIYPLFSELELES
jgi:ABC-type transport system substrate-binding protein